jgi:hypothetical protein
MVCFFASLFFGFLFASMLEASSSYSGRERAIGSNSSRPIPEQHDGVRERELQQMHGQIDGAPAAFLRTCVEPLAGPGGQDLKFTAGRAYMPATAAGVFERPIGGIGLVVDREPAQHFLARDVAQASQMGATV